MAKRVFHVVNYTPTATSDSTAALANGTYMGIRGGAATMRCDVLEVMITGFAPSASSPTIMQLARSGIVASTTTALAAPNSDGPEDPATAALTSPMLTFVGAVGGPQRSASISDARLNLGLNTFGGILRWNASPTQQWVITGNTASGGESTLSAYSGGTVGALSSHIIYEPY
jgi:hypothetical protein